MKPPITILRELENAGYAAYFVGGCVRDTLLGRQIHDWDVTTNARPEQVMAIFPRCIPTGIRHGTVTVLLEDGAYEVTTFRTDGVYRDARHPEQVRFVEELYEDLSRRDFTMNAMAMDAAGSITDPFDGRADLQDRCIRCVGEPEKRFREDALRMLRALRFSAQLGFAVERETARAIAVCAPLCAALSAERVRDELEKTLLSERPDGVEEMIRLGLLERYGVREAESPWQPRQLPRERTVRWAAFFARHPQLRWQDLRLDRHTGEVAQSSAALCGTLHDRMGWKQVLRQWGEEVALCAASLQGQREAVREILDSGECCTRKALAVNGRDFPELRENRLGAVLEALLDHVLLHPEENRRELLLTHGKNISEKTEKTLDNGKVQC